MEEIAQIFDDSEWTTKKSNDIFPAITRCATKWKYHERRHNVVITSYKRTRRVIRQQQQQQHQIVWFLARRWLRFPLASCKHKHIIIIQVGVIYTYLHIYYLRCTNRLSRGESRRFFSCLYLRVRIIAWIVYACLTTNILLYYNCTCGYPN